MKRTLIPAAVLAAAAAVAVAGCGSSSGTKPSIETNRYWQQGKATAESIVQQQRATQAQRIQDCEYDAQLEAQESGWSKQDETDWRLGCLGKA